MKLIDSLKKYIKENTAIPKREIRDAKYESRKPVELKGTKSRKFPKVRLFML
jgi:hypothetical protein